MSILSAALVGLGQVASRFDEEPRPSIWSHAGAYLALPNDYALVGGADPAEEQRARFAKRCPSARLFADPIDMMAQLRPDVVSVCTPPAGRAALVARLLGTWRPQVLLCEKPLALTEPERLSIVTRCQEAKVPLLVNYTRRFQSTYREARRAIAEGRVGRVVSVTIRAPNRLWSIGSHAVNLLCYLAGEAPTAWSVQRLPLLRETDEPAANVLFDLPSGATGALMTMGLREVLLLEADVVGDAGRLVVAGNGDTVVLTPFEPSPHFVGYRVPGPAVELAAADPSHSPFVELMKEAAMLAHGGGEHASSSGSDALRSESIVESIIARCGGAASAS